MLVALLAVQKAGGAFLLLDPKLAQDQQAFLLEDGNVDIMITQERLLSRLSSTVTDRTVILVDSEWQERIAFESVDESVSGVAPGNTACAISVSGGAEHPRVVLGRLMYAGKIFINGWRKSATLRTSYPTPILLRLCG